jgi:hypothetical protein
MLPGGASLARTTEQNKARKSNDFRDGLATGRKPSPEFLPVSIVLRIVFSIDSHCSCACGLSLALARACIVIGVNFPLQIDCIFSAVTCGNPD